jgi:hypothetical protein
MDTFALDLFENAVDAGKNGLHETAIGLLDRCICSGPTPDRAICAYYGLLEEIWHGLGIRDKASPRMAHEDLMWAIRAIECNSKVKKYL